MKVKAFLILHSRIFDIVTKTGKVVSQHIKRIQMFQEMYHNRFLNRFLTFSQKIWM